MVGGARGGEVCGGGGVAEKVEKLLNMSSLVSIESKRT